MPARPKGPWFRKGRGWYTKLRGEQVPLGITDENNKEAAWDAFYALMSEDKVNAQEVPDEDALTLLGLVTRFLRWSEKNCAENTHKEYNRYLKRFMASAGASLQVSRVIKHHVTNWIDGTKLKQGRRNAIGAVQRLFNWAADEGIIKASPLGKIQKPPKRSRDVYYDAATMKKILDACTDDIFRNLLIFCVETGSRPDEARRIEARHVDGSMVVFPVNEHKTGKKTGTERTVYMTPKAARIIRQLKKQYPKGVLFRNSDGNPWNRSSVKDRFRRMREKDPTLPRRLSAGDFRHTFTTDAILNDVNPEKLRILLGHSDLEMISRVYSKVKTQKAHLLNEVKKARGAK